MNTHAWRPLRAAIQIVACLALSPASWAVSPPPVPAYDLDQLTRLALDHNRGLHAARNQVEAAEAGITTARAFPNPELETLGGKVRARVPGVIEGQAHSVWLTQRLEYPWQRSARIDAASAVRDGAVAERRGFEVELLARIKYRFFELLRREAEQKAAAEDLMLMEQISQRVGVRVRTGEAPRYESIKAAAELLNAQKIHQSSGLRVAQAKAALRQLVGGVVPEDFTVKGDLGGVPSLPPLTQLRADLTARNPELQAGRAATLRAQHQLDYERSQRWPALALKAGRETDPEVRGNRVGLVLTLPFWDWRSGPVNEAAAQLARARNSLDEREFALAQALEGAAQQYQIAATQVTALESGIVIQAEAALKVAEAAYRFGERGILDYLDAQRVYRAARNELIAARFELQAAAIDIERLRAEALEGVTP